MVAQAHAPKVFLLLKTACGCTRMVEYFGKPPRDYVMHLAQSRPFDPSQGSLFPELEYALTPLKRTFEIWNHISKDVVEYREVLAP